MYCVYEQKKTKRSDYQSQSSSFSSSANMASASATSLTGSPLPCAAALLPDKTDAVAVAEDGNMPGTFVGGQLKFRRIF
jgi:hypothetical protein